MTLENDYLDFVNNYISLEMFSIDRNISIELARTITSRGKIQHLVNNPKSRNFTQNQNTFSGLSSLQKLSIKKRLNRQLLNEHSA